MFEEFIGLTIEQLYKLPAYWNLIADTKSQFSKVVFSFKDGVISEIAAQEK